MWSNKNVVKLLESVGTMGLSTEIAKELTRDENLGF
jgi:hypothetical protein